MIDFAERKAEKNGYVTPKALIEHLLTEIEKGNIETVVYVTLDKDGEIVAGYSADNNAKIVGMTECGKQNIIEDMRD